VHAIAIAAVAGLCAALALMRPFGQQSSLVFLGLWLVLTIVGLVGYLRLDLRAHGPMVGGERR
jgi:membrane-associated phospholipid phosphatase